MSLREGVRLGATMEEVVVQMMGDGPRKGGRTEKRASPVGRMKQRWS